MQNSIKRAVVVVLLWLFACLPSTCGQDATALDAYRNHVEQLRDQLPSEDFSIVIQHPFVVIGDEPISTLRSRCRKTIKWSVDRLKKDYFDRDPNHIIDIWLFKDKESYEENTKLLFGAKPHTPFGYYSSQHKALVMNISTGGGTLVHEIVHPFIEANFPRCPSWFNEGLASLYEQCGDKDGKIWGYPNWRLNGLHTAIRTKSVPAFEQLCNTTRREFYDDNRGVNYAQARYLCYYLQEKGKLREFYQTFRGGVDKDPTGYQTLTKVLGRPDMGEFETQWKDFVMQLRYP